MGTSRIQRCSECQGVVDPRTGLCPDECEVPTVRRLVARTFMTPGIEVRKGGE